MTHRPARRAAGAALLVALALLLWPRAAYASGDIGCTPAWKLRHHDFTGCDSMAMLSPGNDTRVNLTLLLGRGVRPVTPPRDGQRPQPLFDWPTYEKWVYPATAALGDADHAAGEGSRCLSDAAGAAAFAAALDAAHGVDPAEKAALAAGRRGLQPTCADAGKGASAVATAVARARSPAGKAFAGYLQGAAAFYAGDFDTAAARFAALADNRDPWLRETSRYMLGRVEVNRAQVDLFDEYGSRDDKREPDAKAIAAADALLHQYLQAYPAGRYAGSARGLLRRVYWLDGNIPLLAAEYSALLDKPADARGIDDAALAEEIDTKLLPHLAAADTNDPRLIAVIELQAMRGDDKDTENKALSRAALEAQRPKFARDPALFEHLLAAYAFYVTRDPRAVLRLIPDAAKHPAFDTVQFSRQMLRGMALDAVGDRNARGFWLDLVPGAVPPFQLATVELALALHDERSGGLERVFAADSPIRDATIRDILLTNVAGPALLRQRAGGASDKHERAVALFTLLYKEVTRGAYRDFVADVMQVPADASAKPDIYNFVGTNDPSPGIFTSGTAKEDFACPALVQSARRLVAAPRDATAQLCVAEFMRLNNLDGFFLDTQPPADELGGGTTQFPGRPFSRLEVYKAVIAAPATTASDRAYALFRAVNCYAPSRINGCGGGDVAPAVRRGWFQRLHHDYPASRWAQQLRYYW